MCTALKAEYPSLKYDIMSAPNRFRKMTDDDALTAQKLAWPEKAECAAGKDICFMCWDEVLLWRAA